ncbi:MAG TPA: hypothetical protein VKR56_05660 [Candidatus Cybelea sp.]|nr:hypothetical protein [Candidatus Cybelea sp.]
MPSQVRETLKLYLGQNARRSLRELAKECVAQGIKASLPTLKRWSTRFGWKQHVAEHDRAVTERSICQTVDCQAKAINAYLSLIDSAKNRYYWLVDPENPNVTPAQRKRATNMTVSDYLRVLKMEIEAMKLLKTSGTGRPMEPGRPTAVYTEEEIRIMTAALAEYRHHLPPGSLTKL